MKLVRIISPVHLCTDERRLTLIGGHWKAATPRTIRNSWRYIRSTGGASGFIPVLHIDLIALFVPKRRSGLGGWLGGSRAGKCLIRETESFWLARLPAEKLSCYGIPCQMGNLQIHLGTRRCAHFQPRLTFTQRAHSISCSTLRLNLRIAGRNLFIPQRRKNAN